MSSLAKANVAPCAYRKRRLGEKGGGDVFGVSSAAPIHASLL